jgi:hypothetical protein
LLGVITMDVIHNATDRSQVGEAVIGGHFYNNGPLWHFRESMIRLR